MLDVAIAALVATLLAAGLLVLRARPVGATAIWVWGWVLLFAAYLARTLEGGISGDGGLGVLFASIFPWIQFHGARTYAGRAPRLALVGAGVGMGALRFSLETAGLPAASHGLGLLVDPPLLLGAAWLTHRARGRRGASPAERLLPLAFAGLALLSGVGAARAMGGAPAEPMLAAWLVLAPLTLIGQATAASERASAARRLRERRRARTIRALRASERRYRALAENIEEWIAEIDAEGRIVYLSSRFEESTGRRRSEFVGRNVAEIAPPDVSEETRLAFAQALAGDAVSPVVWSWSPAGGEPRWFESRMRPFETASGERRIVTSTRDVTDQRRLENEARRARSDLERRVVERTRDLVTANADLERQVAERKRVEHQLRESEERYRRVSELASDYSYAIRLEVAGDWEVLWMSGAFARITGYDLEQALARGWSTIVEPEDWPALQELYAAMLPGREGEHEFRIRTPDGTVRWLRERIRAERDPGSDATLFYCAAHDITERKQAEEQRERAEARLRETERLESMGVLAAGLAHDFNNLLTPILGNSRAGAEEAPPGSGLRRRFERIRQAGEVAAALVRQMRTVAGQRPFEKEKLDLSGLVRSLEPVLEAGLGGRIRLLTQLADGLPPLEGDATQIRQVVLNLVSNAAESVGGAGGTIWVRTDCVEADRSLLSQAVHRSELSEGPSLVLEVRDDGAGMDAATRDHVFEPFYSTKRSGRGLGLPAVLGIVLGHGGAILLDSAPGAGTCVRILLPAGGGSVPLRRAPAQPGRPVRGHVLVIDDDAAVSELVREFLERAGFECTSAVGGAAGLEAFRAVPGAVDAVVLDWRMPDLDGETVLREIRRSVPALPVVVVSGLEEVVEHAQRSAGGATGFLRKPFEPEALVKAVQEVLARSGTAADPDPAAERAAEVPASRG